MAEGLHASQLGRLHGVPFIRAIAGCSESMKRCARAKALSFVAAASRGSSSSSSKRMCARSSCSGHNRSIRDGGLAGRIPGLSCFIGLEGRRIEEVVCAVECHGFSGDSGLVCWECEAWRKSLDPQSIARHSSCQLSHVGTSGKSLQEGFPDVLSSSRTLPSYLIMQRNKYATATSGKLPELCIDRILYVKPMNSR